VRYAKGNLEGFYFKGSLSQKHANLAPLKGFGSPLGSPLAEKQKRVGHASAKTTLDVYGHLFDGADVVKMLRSAWQDKTADL